MTEQREATTREQLIRVAEVMFAERGIGAVSLREIGERAGQRNKTAIHYRFGGKEGLVRAILSFWSEAVNARRQEILASLAVEGRLDDCRRVGGCCRPACRRTGRRGQPLRRLPRSPQSGAGVERVAGRPRRVGRLEPERRVASLLKRSAHAEWPHSRTRRMITNVRIVAVDGNRVSVHANFTVHRIRGRETATYLGRYEYLLDVADGGIRIHARTAILDHEALRPEGKISIIL
jgi:AcrR family transcriptional regulator